MALIKCYRLYCAYASAFCPLFIFCNLILCCFTFFFPSLLTSSSYLPFAITTIYNRSKNCPQNISLIFPSLESLSVHSHFVFFYLSISTFRFSLEKALSALSDF